MKKDFTNRTRYPSEVIRNAIEKWLDNPTSLQCPFQRLTVCDVSERFCSQVFPRVSECRTCPCANYSLKYVIHVAKQAMEALQPKGK